MSGREEAVLRLSLLRDIVSAMPRPGGRAEFYASLLDALFRTMDVRRGLLALRDPEDGTLRTVASRNLDAADPDEKVEVSRAVLRPSLEKGLAQRLDDAMAEPSLRATESVRRLEIRSVLCVPVPVGGKPSGVLYADNRGRTASFGEEDLQFLEMLGRLAGVALENLEHAERLDRDNESLRSSLREDARLLTASPLMEETLKLVRLVAASDASVLVAGESGVGKELVALEIHRRSARRGGPFVAMNCAAIPESLLEAEMFGLAPRSGVAGAPSEGREGRFERAGGGTLFLDEIADMGASSQARILRVLEERKVDRIGGSEPVPVDLRIVAATNRDLEREVAAGRFRQDLFFRLKVVEIDVPPLRDRREDVLLLAEHFLKRFAGDRLRLSPAACEALLRHAWPGNVRELRNAVERAAILCEGREVGVEHLPPALAVPGGAPVDAVQPLTLEAMEREHVGRMLRLAGGSPVEAARLLGIARSTLYVKMEKYGLRAPGEDPGPAAGRTA
jgi:transcriptional regulator with GAF, ATPase, and Fis domain